MAPALLGVQIGRQAHFQLRLLDRGTGLDFVKQVFPLGIVGANPLLTDGAAEAVQRPGVEFAVQQSNLDLIQHIQQLAGSSDCPHAAFQRPLDLLQGDQGIKRADTGDIGCPRRRCGTGNPGEA